MLSAIQPFLFGGIAGCVATTVVQPIDMIKVRLQLAAEVVIPPTSTTSTSAPPPPPRPTALSMGRDIIKNEGARALWKGISAGYLRQLVYGSARLGLFKTFNDALRERRENGTPVPLYQKVMAGASSGALSSIVGVPADLVLVRMQSDATMPEAQRRNYKGIVDAFTRIVKDEGVLGLWRASTPTVIRAIALNAAMMSVSEQAKETLGPYFGGPKSMSTAFVSAALSGVAAAVASLPPDLVKIRLQRMNPDPVTGKLPYTGFFDCARKIATREGIGGFYVGTGTYIFRIAPHAFITLLVLDGINWTVAQYKEKQKMEQK